MDAVSCSAAAAAAVSDDAAAAAARAAERSLSSSAERLRFAADFDILWFALELQ